MKRFFWAKFLETNSGSWKRSAKNTEADFWDALALKKAGSVIHIPQRKFIGESQEFTSKISNTIENEISKILQQ